MKISLPIFSILLLIYGCSTQPTNLSDKSAHNNMAISSQERLPSSELTTEEINDEFDRKRKEMYDKAMKKLGLEGKSSEEIRKTIRAQAKKEINKLGYKINDEIWNKFENVTLLSKAIGRVSFQIQSQRRVIDNLDGMSFTVTDNLTIPVGTNLFSASLGNIIRTQIPLSYSVNAGGAVEFMNIKQSFVGDSISFKDDYDQFKLRVKTISKLDLLKSNAEEIHQLEENHDERDFIDVTNPNKDKGISLDKNLQARYFTTLNRISFPLRIPIRAEWTKNLSNNEIISYAGTGGISFGPSMSLNLGLPTLNGSVSVSTYLKGTFRITIMKVENEVGEERILLKINRAKTTGNNLSYNISSNNEIYEGFTVLGFTNGRTNFDIKLLDTNFMRGKENSVEIGYEFDLSEPEAREAYNKATLGMLEDADNLALSNFADKKDNGVRFLYKKHGRKDLESLNKKFQLSFLKEKTMDCTKNIENSKTSIQEEEYTGITGIFGCNIFASGLMRGKLEQSFRFIVENQVNLKKRDTKKEWAFEMHGYLKDSQTNGYELEKYTQSINDLFNERNLIPSFPTTTVKRVPYHKMKFPPSEEEVRQARFDQKTNTPIFDETQIMDYGITQVNYSVRFGQEHIQKFFNLEEEEFLNYVAIGFELPPESLPITRGKLIANTVGDYIFMGIPGMFQVENKIITRHKSILFFYDAWKKIKQLNEEHHFFAERSEEIKDEVEGKKEVANLLKKMFSSPTWGYYYQRVFMLALVGERVERHLVFSSSALPKPIQIQDSIKIPAINTVTHSFEKISSNKVVYEGLDNSPDAQVSDLEVTPLDPYRFELKFKTKKKPRFVKFTLSGSNGFSIFNQEVVSLLVINQTINEESNESTFEEGENIMIFDKFLPDHFLSFLAQAVENEVLYKISVSVSNDGKKFGLTSTSKEFLLFAPEKPKKGLFSDD